MSCNYNIATPLISNSLAFSRQWTGRTGKRAKDVFIRTREFRTNASTLSSSHHTRVNLPPFYRTGISKSSNVHSDRKMDNDNVTSSSNSASVTYPTICISNIIGPVNNSLTTTSSHADGGGEKSRRRRRRRHGKSVPGGLPYYTYKERTPNARLFYIWEASKADEYLGKSSLCSPNINEDNKICIGFDMEWVPQRRPRQPQNPVALIQIATEFEIFLLQIIKMDRFPEKLKEILLNKNIIKFGVNILNDCEKLYRDCMKLFGDGSILTHSCVELTYYARSMDPKQWPVPHIGLIGLARLVQVYEKQDLEKGKTQLSDWSADLDERQVHYAANDAHSACIVAQHIESKANSMDPSQRPASGTYMFHVIEGRPIRLHNDVCSMPEPS